MDGVHDQNRLKELQKLPLERKIMITQTRLIEWYKHYDGQVYVSFSGGKDSTVLLDIARKMFPGIPAVFINTGLEFPEVRRFALSHENVTEIRPRWGRNRFGKTPGNLVTFRDILSTHGYPVVSKQVCDVLQGARRNPHSTRMQRLEGTFLRRDGGFSALDAKRWRPMYDLPVRFSDRCCDLSKKNPQHVYQKETGRKVILATMAEESLRRRTSWVQTGCNAFTKGNEASRPMSFWTNQDVLEYIRRNQLPICSVYGEIETDAKGKHHCTGCQRTGCIFCAFGAHIGKGESRFQQLKRTHPHQYEYCMSGGEFTPNPDYDPAAPAGSWNPKEIWGPSKGGYGMAKVFDWMNDIYGKDFLPYD